MISSFNGWYSGRVGLIITIANYIVRKSYGTTQIQRGTRSTFFIESRVRVEQTYFSTLTARRIDIQPQCKGIQFCIQVRIIRFGDFFS